MTFSQRSREPILNLPPMVTALLAVNIGVHVLRFLLPARWDATVVISLGFIPARYTLADSLGWQAIVAPFSYQFLHGGLLHLALNMTMLAAFGSGVERRMGGGRMLGLALVAGIAGAAAHLAVYPGSINPVVGASGAISGLFGAVLRLMPRRQGGFDGLLPIVALWVVLIVVTGAVGVPGGGASIAWVAHLGGFIAGLALFGWFDRPVR